jgi:hypothetical protein
MLDFSLEEAERIQKKNLGGWESYGLELPSGRLVHYADGELVAEADIVIAGYLALRAIAELAGEPQPEKPMLDYMTLYRYRDFITAEERRYMEACIADAERLGEGRVTAVTDSVE